MSNEQVKLPSLPEQNPDMLPKNSPEQKEAQAKTEAAYNARMANAGLAEKARLYMAKGVSGQYAAVQQFDYLKK